MKALVESGRIGKRGAWVIPVTLRRRFGLDEGTLLIAEETPEGILLRPAEVVAVPLEAPEDRARRMLLSAKSATDRAHADKAVRRMGLDPDELAGRTRARGKPGSGNRP